MTKTNLLNKKNAFTLAELLAVITILGVIALIVFPAVNKAIKNSKEKSYNQQVDSILDSAENWTTENMSQLSDTNDNYITIGELQQSGYLEAKKVINPITDEEMNGCIVIKYDTNYSQYTYRYEEESCDVVKPTIYTFQEVMEPLLGTKVGNNDPDGNLRYVGVDPDNYVWFNKDESGNKERWRIIGLFNGQAKIIRNDYYDDSFRFAPLQENYWAGSFVDVEFRETYLPNIQTRDLISYNYIDLDHVWNVSGVYWNGETRTRDKYFVFEREDSSAYETWQGAIGLMYVSDYGYASDGNGEICDGVDMYYWDGYNDEEVFVECAQKSWLYDSNNGQWTITTQLDYPRSDDYGYMMSVRKYGNVPNTETVLQLGIRPVVYLESSVVIVGGNGTYDDPYVLSME